MEDLDFKANLDFWLHKTPSSLGRYCLFRQMLTTHHAFTARLPSISLVDLRVLPPSPKWGGVCYAGLFMLACFDFIYKL